MHSAHHNKSKQPAYRIVLNCVCQNSWKAPHLVYGIVNAQTDTSLIYFSNHRQQHYSHYIIYVYTHAKMRYHTHKTIFNKLNHTKLNGPCCWCNCISVGKTRKFTTKSRINIKHIYLIQQFKFLGISLQAIRYRTGV